MLIPLASDAPLSFRVLRFAALLAVGYGLLAWFGITLPGKSGFSSYFWPAAGFGVACLLRTPKRHWPVLILAIYLTGVVNGMRAGYPLLENLLNAISPLQVLVNALALHAAMRGRIEVDSMKRVALFAGVALVATAAVSFLGGLYIHATMGRPLLPEWRVWFIADFLGILLLGPLVLAWSTPELDRRADQESARKLEFVLMYVGLLIATIWIYGTPRDPLISTRAPTFLCIPFLLWGALRFGMRGATLTLTTFTGIVLWCTARGVGPFAAIDVAIEQAALQAQTYLVAIITMVLLGGSIMYERQKAQRENETWRRRYEAAIAASESLVYEIDPHLGAIVWAGDTRKVLGLDQREISSLRGWTERVHVDDRSNLLQLREQLMSGAKPSVALEYRVRRDDGSYFTVGVNAYAIDSDEIPGSGAGRRIVGFVKDITEKKRAAAERQLLEEKLNQAQKMEAIGRLAGGIAHDFNNILGAILGYGEMAQAKVPPGSDVRRHLDTILAAGERGKALVAQILAFSRARPAERQPVLVAALLDEVAALVQGSLPANITLCLAVTDRSLMVLGEVTQLHQLLMNLATNAVQAMPQGGTLTLAAYARQIEAPHVARLGNLQPGRCVVVEVTDTGEGMDSDTLANIFEPFFTTKAIGRGTGLGLALAHGIAVSHGGAMDVTSQRGSGSTFTVYLPDMPPIAQQQAALESSLSRGNGQCILVVDDEPAMLHLAEELLADLGYEPVGHGSSEDALTAFLAAPGRFDAILTDEVMPQLTGTELTARIRALHYRVPVLLISGYGGPGFVIRAHSAGVNQLLRKPYHKRDLAEALAAVLDGPGTVAVTA